MKDCCIFIALVFILCLLGRSCIDSSKSRGSRSSTECDEFTSEQSSSGKSKDKADNEISSGDEPCCDNITWTRTTEPAKIYRSREACTVEVLVRVNDSSEYKPQIMACESFGICCPVKQKSIVGWELNGANETYMHILNTTLSYTTGDGFAVLPISISEEALNDLPARNLRELNLSMTYHYSCDWEGKKSDCHHLAPHYCCKSGNNRTHEQNVTVVVKFIQVSIQLKCMDKQTFRDISNATDDSAVKENMTVQVLCATNLNDSSPYWVFFRGGTSDSEVWCSPGGTNQGRRVHKGNVITYRGSDNSDCIMEIPSVKLEDNGAYECGIVKASELNEFRNLASVPKTLTVRKEVEEHEDDNGKSSQSNTLVKALGTTLGTAAVLFLAIVAIVSFVVKRRRSKRAQPEIRLLEQDAEHYLIETAPILTTGSSGSSDYRSVDSYRARDQAVAQQLHSQPSTTSAQIEESTKSVASSASASAVASSQSMARRRSTITLIRSFDSGSTAPWPASAESSSSSYETADDISLCSQ